MRAILELPDGSKRDLATFPAIFDNEHGRPPINDTGADIQFSAVRIEGGDYLEAIGSVDDFLIPPRASGDPHVWPRGAALPVFSLSPVWGEPAPDHVARVLGELHRTTQIGTIDQFPRMAKMVSILKDDRLPMWPVPGDQDRSFGATDEGWEHRFGPGAPTRTGWYSGALRYGTEGLDNDHYNRTFWRLVNYCRNPSPELWAWCQRFTFGRMLYGQSWAGANVGAARTEKSDETLIVGRQRGQDIVLREKQWIHGVALEALLTGNPLAVAALNKGADYLLSIDPASWHGYWGARVLAMPMDSVTVVGMALPNRRSEAIEWLGRALDEALKFLDRDLWYWPNLGDPTGQTNSPWMQGNLCARISRAKEQYPSLANRGPSDDDLRRLLEGIWTYGVEVVGAYRITEYRWDADADDSDDQDDQGLHNTAWQIPALRYMASRFPRMDALYREALEVVTEFMGSSKEDLRAGVPRSLDMVGARTPSQGLGFRKTAVFPLEMFR